jgi:tetratricopeptide (TPR) repeat protein
VVSQNMDSLKLELKNAKHDTTRCNILNTMVEAEYDDKVWPIYNEQLRILAKKNIKTNKINKTFYLKHHTTALSNKGYLYEIQGNIPKALQYYYKSLKIQEEIGDKEGIATILNNIGFIYTRQGDIPKALQYLHKSLKIDEDMGNKSGIATSLNNIGFIYNGQGDILKAFEYYHKSLKIREEIGDKVEIAQSLNNIGSICKKQGQTKKAFDYYIRSLKIQEEIGDKKGIAICFNNIGLIYYKQGDIPKALEYYHKSLKIQEEIGDKKGITTSLNNIGGLQFEQGNLVAAKKNGEKSLAIAREIASPNDIRAAASSLSDIYKKQGKGMKALEMYKLSVKMKDSINNEETQKATIRQQTKYEFEKAQIVKENEAKEQARVLSEATGRRDNIQYSLIFLGILVLFGIVLSLGFIKVSPTIAEGIIFFAFLILFEFVLVFTEPYMEQYTNSEPMYNLLANSVLALVIFPLHAILEKLLKKRIVKS